MPNRILREGILDSESVNALSPEAEVFYRRLMSVVDDFGRFDGRLTVLRARLYPLQLEKVREASLERWIAECVKARLVRLYEHNGSQYILFLKLGVPRAKVSKYPPPPPDADTCAHMRADASTRDPPRADVPYSYSSSYSGSNSNSHTIAREGDDGPEAGEGVCESFRPEPFSELAAEWQAAGLPGGAPLQRTPFRAGLFENRQRDPPWRARWRDAVRRAGRSDRCRGLVGAWSLRVEAFLKDADMVVRILEGEFDNPQPTSQAGSGAPAPSKRTRELDAVLARASAAKET